MIDQNHIDRVAEACHEALRQISLTMGQTGTVSWADTPEEAREITIGAVTDLVIDPTLTPKMLHENWVKRKEAQGWVYGEVKDRVAKTHPCIIDYNRLPLGERYKDLMFRMVASVHLSLLGFFLDDPYTSKKREHEKA